MARTKGSASRRLRDQAIGAASGAQRGAVRGARAGGLPGAQVGAAIGATMGAKVGSGGVTAQRARGQINQLRRAVVRNRTAKMPTGLP